MALGVASALALAFAAPASADQVTLRNGAVVEGRVLIRGDVIEVRLNLGTVRFKRSEVLRVERKALPADVYAEMAATTSFDDPQEVLELSAWCEENGLQDKARELREMAKGLVLDLRVREVAPSDAAGFYALALWAREQGYSNEVRRYLLSKALEADPGSVAARSELAAIAEEEAAERREIALAEERTRLERERQALERERRRLEAERREAEEAEARAAEAYAAAEASSSTYYDEAPLVISTYRRSYYSGGYYYGGSYCPPTYYDKCAPRYYPRYTYTRPYCPPRTYVQPRSRGTGRAIHAGGSYSRGGLSARVSYGSGGVRVGVGYSSGGGRGCR